MKKRTLNEYRQTKEYQSSSGFKDVVFDDLEDSEKLKKLEEAHKIPEEIKEINLNEQIQEIAGNS